MIEFAMRPCEPFRQEVFKGQEIVGSYCFKRSSVGLCAPSSWVEPAHSSLRLMVTEQMLVRAVLYVVIDRDTVLIYAATTYRACRVRRGVRDGRPRMRERKVKTLDRSTTVSHIGSQHDRPLFRKVSLHSRGRAVASINCDVSAVHIHFPIPELVEPRPREQSASCWYVTGQLELPCRRQRAVSNIRVHRACKAEIVRLSGLPAHHRCALLCIEQRMIALTREIASVGAERCRHVIVDIGRVRVEFGAEGWWPTHLHVPMRDAQDAKKKINRRNHSSLHDYES
ncbi:hypothetical protein IF2G_10892 [Cordyceps javanica]|nr:hypothetical protein IF2G_10892 [Cordyceps javanica]